MLTHDPMIGSCVSLYRRAPANHVSLLFYPRYFDAVPKITTHDPMRDWGADGREEPDLGPVTSGPNTPGSLFYWRRKSARIFIRQYHSPQ